MDTPNPNVCPTCGSRNTGATFGWKPQRVNENETINIVLAKRNFGNVRQAKRLAKRKKN